MLPQILLSIALAGASVSCSEDESTSLADAIRLINEQAAKLAESRSQKPLTEDEVVDAIKKFARDERKLAEPDYRKLQQVAEKRRLPKDVILRQFVRYNEGTGVQHGWWVRLMLLRKDQSPFVLTLREEVLLRRPYSQMERQFQDEVDRTGMPTLNRLVTYFDENPKFTVTQPFSKPDADKLADAVKKAIADRNPVELEKYYHWEGVVEGARARVRKEAEQLTKRQLSTVSVTPRRFGGRLNHSQSFQIWDPNLPVLGHIVLEFSDKEEPNSVSLEFGETRDGARLVNYIVSRDDSPRFLGKRLSGPVSVSGLPSVQLPDGSLEMETQIEAPEELSALRNANFELWKIRPKAE
jgi:hypothetical protein